MASSLRGLRQRAFLTDTALQHATQCCFTQPYGRRTTSQRYFTVLPYSRKHFPSSYILVSPHKSSQTCQQPRILEFSHPVTANSETYGPYISVVQRRIIGNCQGRGGVVQPKRTGG